MAHPLIPLIRECLNSSLPEDAKAWLDATLDKENAAFDRRRFYFAFSGASRHIPEREFELSPEQFEIAKKEGWNPQNWTTTQAVRSLLVSQIPASPPSEFEAIISQLFKTADLKEQIALQSSLFLLPHPDKLLGWATEGIRSNIQSVIDAISLDNPYPKSHFPEMPWNQLVLKALFNGRPIYRIHGLDERANPALSQALVNFAHERWAADRYVSPELWRSCQGYLDESAIPDLERVATTEEPMQKEAVALVAHSSPCTSIRKHFADLQKDYREMIENGELSWESIGQSLA